MPLKSPTDLSDEKPTAPNLPEVVQPAIVVPPKKPGRPKANIDWQVVEALARIGCGLAEIASMIDVPEQTLRNKSHRKKIKALIDAGGNRSRASLRRRLYAMATGTLHDAETGERLKVSLDLQFKAAVFLARQKQYLGFDDGEREDAANPFLTKTRVVLHVLHRADNVIEAEAVKALGDGTDNSR